MHLHTVHYGSYPDRLVVPADEGEVDGYSALRSTVVTGDALDVLADLPDGLARTVVTSPPYWSLRDYSITGQIGLKTILTNTLPRSCVSLVKCAVSSPTTGHSG